MMRTQFPVSVEQSGGPRSWSKNDPEKTGWSHQVEFRDLQDLLQAWLGNRAARRGNRRGASASCRHT
jgi:hypothetical protein